MKHNCSTKILAPLCLALLLALLPAAGFAQPEGEALTLSIRRIDGPAESAICYPVVEALDAAYAPVAEKINARILEKARIEEYKRLLDTLAPGGAGLVITCEAYASPDFSQGRGFLSIVLSAQGKMLSGRPSQAYYPMTFSLETGEELSFSDVFAHPDAARAQIEARMEEEVEPTLSTYLENSALLPVPYDSFALTDTGLITFYYENSQLSFLSGRSGTVSFRYSELWDALNTVEGAAPLGMLAENRYAQRLGEEIDTAALFEAACAQGAMPGLDALPAGGTVEALKARYAFSIDSGFYPGGAFLEPEDAALRGTVYLTDENEENVTGILTSRVDAYGVETGFTSLEQALSLLGQPARQESVDAEAAEYLLVCPGTAATFSYTTPSGQAECTLYADAEQTVRYIRVQLLENP